MKIKKLKINHFGKLEDKEIQFADHINIVQGNNESGKSTLLKFIANIFYGASKNKKGKEFSDYDRYKPWSQEEFSGRITYTLDNGEKYEVFRDFSKKNPTIYNEQLEDISKQFTIDKTYGNQFFIEQTNVEENMFYSTLVSMQQEVKLEQNTQNAMVQKVANLAGTGDDSVSYQKALDKINKKQLEEIGTTRSQGRPINIVKEEKFKVQDEIGTLEEYKERKQEILQEKEEKQKEIKQIEEIVEIIKKVKNIKENEKIEKEKIKLAENLKESQEQKKKQLETQKEMQEQELQKQEFQEQEVKKNQEGKTQKDKKITPSIILLIINIFLEAISIIIQKSNILIGIFAFTIVLSIIWLLLEIRKQKIQKEKQKQKVQIQQKQNTEIKQSLEAIQTEIRILQNNIEEQEKEIQNQKELMQEKENIEKEKIKENSNQIEKIEELFKSENINWQLESKEEEKNRKKLEYHSLELEENTISPKLEKIALLEEQLEDLKQREEELNKENEAMELSKEILEIAYTKMKQNITPKLTNQLSKNVEKISNGKYKKVHLSEENGLTIEKDNGEYIEAEKLSIGTIDQLYLSLRLAMVKELTQESMPIILDEAFAYYDEERLKNILQYLDSEFPDNQIIIFTCTNREKEIAEKCGIEHQIIEL